MESCGSDDDETYFFQHFTAELEQLIEHQLKTGARTLKLASAEGLDTYWTFFSHNLIFIILKKAC